MEQRTADRNPKHDTKPRIMKNKRKALLPTGKTVELIAAAIVAIIITMATIKLISWAGQSATECGILDAWVADTLNINTC